MAASLATHARPTGRRRRRRRGIARAAVSGRIYRVTWALVALPLLVAAFTVGRPGAPSAAGPPAVVRPAAASAARPRLRGRFPIRAPGDAGAARGDRVGARAPRGIQPRPSRSRASRPTPRPRPGRSSSNLVARPPASGPSARPRRSSSWRDRDNLGTAPGLDRQRLRDGCADRARARISRRSRSRTRSSSSRPTAAPGADSVPRSSREDAAFREQRPRRRQPRLARRDAARRGSSCAATTSRSPAAALRRNRRREHRRRDRAARRRTPSAFDQLLDLAFPFSLYDQAPLLGDAASPTLTLTTAGDRPPEARTPTSPRRDRARRLGQLGRSAQALVISLDGAAGGRTAGPSPTSTSGAACCAASRSSSSCSSRCLPVLVATIDLSARLRRRELRARRRAAQLPQPARRLVLGRRPGGALHRSSACSRTASRARCPLDMRAAQDWPFAALAGLAGHHRRSVGSSRASGSCRGAPSSASDELAGHLARDARPLRHRRAVLAVTNPYALALPPAVAPRLALGAPRPRPPPRWSRVAVYAVGFAGPAGLLLTAYAVRFDLGLDAPWYVTTLFTVGYAPVDAARRSCSSGARRPARSARSCSAATRRIRPRMTARARRRAGERQAHGAARAVASPEPERLEPAWRPEERIPAGEPDRVPRRGLRRARGTDGSPAGELAAPAGNVDERVRRAAETIMCESWPATGCRRSTVRPAARRGRARTRRGSRSAQRARRERPVENAGSGSRNARAARLIAGRTKQLEADEGGHGIPGQVEDEVVAADIRRRRACRA